MRSEVLKRVLEKTPPEVDVFIDWYADLVTRVNKTLYHHVDVLFVNDFIEKYPQIHLWINGKFDFSLESLAKLQVELGITLLEIKK